MAETEYVGVWAAAKVIGVNPSTVSRYLKDHPELNHAASESDPLVIDVEELTRHRAGNVNHAMSGNHAGLLQDEQEASAADDVEGGERRSPAASAKGGGKTNNLELTRARAVHEGTKATMAQIELAERLGSVAAVQVVVAACDEAAAQLKQALKVRARQIADELAGMTDPRAIAALLEASDRELLERVSGEFERNVFGADGEAAAA